MDSLLLNPVKPEIKKSRNIFQTSITHYYKKRTKLPQTKIDVIK